MKIYIAAAVAIAWATIAEAHGGGLNAEGCHNNRQTGDYHWHRGASTGASRAPARTYRPMGVGAGTRPYANCSAARAAGAAPDYAGTSAYGPHLDRDGDGIGCE